MAIEVGPLGTPGNGVPIVVRLPFGNGNMPELTDLQCTAPVKTRLRR